MKRAIQALTVAAIGLGGLTVATPDADAQRVYRRSGPVVVYRRPIPRYYYAAPILAAPAIAYYSSGRRYTCAQLEFKCDRGEEWACRTLDRDPSC